MIRKICFPSAMVYHYSFLMLRSSDGDILFDSTHCIAVVRIILHHVHGKLSALHIVCTKQNHSLPSTSW